MWAPTPSFVESVVWMRQSLALQRLVLRLGWEAAAGFVSSSLEKV